MTTAKKARGGPLPALKRFVHSKHMVTLVWILGIVVVWEIFACIVAATKRTPVNVLPHLYEIIGSFFSDKKVTGKMTMIELIGTACGETLSRAGIGFLAGIAAGYILALLMNLSRVVEKIAFPYLMIIQMMGVKPHQRQRGRHGAAGSSSGISEIRSGAGIQELQLRRLTGWRGGDKGTFLTTPGMWDFISK